MASFMFFSWSNTKRATMELSSAVDGIFMLLADFRRSRTLFKSESIYTVANLESRNLYSLARSKNICQLSVVSPCCSVYSRASSFPSAFGNFLAAGADLSFSSAGAAGLVCRVGSWCTGSRMGSGSGAISSSGSGKA